MVQKLIKPVSVPLISLQQGLISAVGRKAGQMQAIAFQAKISHRRKHGVYNASVFFLFEAAG